MKIRQGCSLILLSKLFQVNYDKTSPYLGVIKFNNKLKINRNLIPLGGINLKTLNKLKNINCKGFAMLSEIKKKPANIINRLF
jgi:thiamine monophosphate synthase